MGQLSSRRARRDLTTEELVEQSLEIARRDGEKGLTMRALAAKCGVTPNALYHHVGDKEELLTLIVDHVVGSSLEPLGADTSRWSEELLDVLCRFRRAFLSDPLAASVLIRRPVVSPSMARFTEQLFELVERGGFEGDALPATVDAIVLVLLGSIANDLSRPAEVRAALRGHVPDAEVPLMVSHLQSYARRDPEQRFRNAVAALIVGLHPTATKRRDTAH